MNAAIKKAIEQSPIAQQAMAAKQGINQLSSAIQNVGPGIQEAVGEQLNAQKEAVKALVDERIAAAVPSGNTGEGVENEPTEEENYTAEEGEEEYYPENEGYEGGARRRYRRRSRAKKISRRSIRQMASRRGSRRATRRRATRKGRRASRKAQRK